MDKIIIDIVDNYFEKEPEYPLIVDKIYYRLLSECSKKGLLEKKLTLEEISEITEIKIETITKYMKMVEEIHSGIWYSRSISQGERYRVYASIHKNNSSIYLPIWIIDAIYRDEALSLEEAQVFIYFKLGKQHQIFLKEINGKNTQFEDIIHYKRIDVIAKRVKRSESDIQKNIESLINKGFLTEEEIKEKNDFEPIIKENFSIQIELIFESGEKGEITRNCGINKGNALYSDVKERFSKHCKNNKEKLKNIALKEISRLYPDQKVIMINYFIIESRFYNDRQGNTVSTILNKDFLAGELVIEPVTKIEIKEKEVIRYVKQKESFYVYKHFYYDKKGRENVFYIGKGTGDAKGSESRIYSHDRNKYWKEIVSDLNKKGIKYFEEPIKFFEKESDALNFEAEQHKKYWGMGQCRGCADLRRRYRC